MPSCLQGWIASQAARVEVPKGAIASELVIGSLDSVVKVKVVMEAGLPVSGAMITVGKSSGGTVKSLFTYRKGHTNDKGEFEATALTDGRYVVVAEYGTEKTSKILEITTVRL